LPAKAPKPLATLKKRPEFLRVRGGARFGTASFLMEARMRLCGAGCCDDSATHGRAEGCEANAEKDMADGATIAGARFGLTVTKKIGNAVIRNRIRRRLKEALRSVAPTHARAGCDYVLIARTMALSQQFAELCGDLKKAFQRVNSALDNPRRSGGRR